MKFNNLEKEVEKLNSSNTYEDLEKTLKLISQDVLMGIL